MENENYQKEIIIIENNDFESKNVFKFDYISQKLDNSIEYQNWKQAMQKKYGRNAKQFKCLIDNILFYTSYTECRSYPSYKAECPICKKYICFFCSNSIVNENEKDNVICCLRRRIFKLFFYDGLRYIKKININDIDKQHILNNNTYIIFFIPFLNLGFFIIRIFDFLYFSLASKASKRNNVDKLESNIEHLEKKSYHIYFIVISNLISLFFCISYFIYSIYFMFFILIISVPFKFLPFKYYSGIFFSEY